MSEIKLGNYRDKDLLAYPLLSVTTSTLDLKTLLFSLG